jgi:diguanylate cyclase (GGDEF) domain
MFYLSFDNQIQLLLLQSFSAYMFATCLTVKTHDTRLRAMGLSFFIPLVLAGYSFLVSPYNVNAASVYLDLSWFLLILLLVLISLVRKPADALKFLYVIIFLLPVGAILIQKRLTGLNYTMYIQTANLVLAAAQFIMTVVSLICRNRDSALLHSGILLTSVGFALFLYESGNWVLALLPAGAGLFVCALYLYLNTYGKLKSEHERYSLELDRINQSIRAEVTRRVNEIERAGRLTARSVKTDGMTGLYLKSTLISLMESMTERMPYSSFSVLLIDIDDFGKINEGLGRQAGDRCIRSVSGLIQASFRKDDITARFGGDEFAVILPGVSSVRACLSAERFRQAVQEKSDPKVTVSIGIATYPDDADNVTALLEAAGRALDVSRRNGKNRITCYSMLHKN